MKPLRAYLTEFVYLLYPPREGARGELTNEETLGVLTGLLALMALAVWLERPG